MKGPTNQYKVYAFSSSGSVLSSSTSADVTASFSATNWRISDDCHTISADATVYSLATSTPKSVTNSATISWLDLDNTLVYALTAGNIMKYAASTNTYATVFSNVSAAFTAGSKITSYSNRIVIVSPATASSVSV